MAIYLIGNAIFSLETECKLFNLENSLLNSISMSFWEFMAFCYEKFLNTLA